MKRRLWAGLAVACAMIGLGGTALASSSITHAAARAAALREVKHIAAELNREPSNAHNQIIKTSALCPSRNRVAARQWICNLYILYQDKVYCGIQVLGTLNPVSGVIREEQYSTARCAHVGKPLSPCGAAVCTTGSVSTLRPQSKSEARLFLTKARAQRAIQANADTAARTYNASPDNAGRLIDHVFVGCLNHGRVNNVTWRCQEAFIIFSVNEACTQNVTVTLTHSGITIRADGQTTCEAI